MKTIEYTISEADAVRHLIVCDTQFAWAGVTNLTMPQMMDLQVRGWVVEGDDNDEFQLTEAGEAVVARALQHGVPKTLADVQPGGMVKLGDSRSTRAATFLRQYLTYLRSSPRQGLRPRWCDVYEALEIAIESLSAQPSLGGQWDLKSRFTEWVKANGYNPATFASGRFMGDGVQIAWEAVQALAAPQPVYLQGCDELRARTEGERAAYMEGLEEGKKIAARQPVGEPVAVIENGAFGGGGLLWIGPMPPIGTKLYAAPPAQAVAARQPVGEPPMEMRICELRHVSLKPNRPYIFTVDANCANCSADAAYAMGQTDTRPAQAVDLGQIWQQAFNDTAHSYRRNKSRMWVLQMLKERVQALIDSQAVGNG